MNGASVSLLSSRTLYDHPPPPRCGLGARIPPINPTPPSPPLIAMWFPQDPHQPSFFFPHCAAHRHLLNAAAALGFGF
ncbi:hypothetical protein L484_027786 [Morus notabilis]|uniref:Uncharacterized protein n=1 Tax=Morus notabilis TaxID=981085 RepID=W9RD28_9ROSA|nr:hypothetical protein L484_027786 [Morus notabilis]